MDRWEHKSIDVSSLEFSFLAGGVVRFLVLVAIGTSGATAFAGVTVFSFCDTPQS
jgi:hypothetical protein